MPSNSAEYQRQYRLKNAKRRKEVSVTLPIDLHREFSAFAKEQGMSLAGLMREATDQTLIPGSCRPQKSWRLKSLLRRPLQRAIWPENCAIGARTWFICTHPGRRSLPDKCTAR